MSKAQFLKALNGFDTNEKRIQAIESVYGAEVKGILAKLVSYADTEDFFDEERRALSYAEIYNPQKNLGVDFVEIGCIPVVDVFDSTYIVYSIKEKKWAMFSSTDNVLFKKKNSFEEMV